jgi:PAS domain S-box-containing protein
MLATQNHIDKTLTFITKKGYVNFNKEFIKTTAKFLGNLLQIDYVLINKYSIDFPGKTDTLVVYHKDKFLPNISYELKNTPCNNVINKNISACKSNVQSKYPKDIMLVDMNVDSYIGIPLWSSVGEPIGLIAFIDSSAIRTQKKIETILKIIAVKVEKVLEKINYERKLQQKLNALNETKNLVKKSEEKFKKLSNLAFEGVLIHNKGIAIDLNLSLSQMFGYNIKELLGKDMVELLIPKKYHTIIFNKRAKGSPTPYELEGKRKDGTIFPIEIETRKFKAEDNKTYTVTSIRDLTKRKKVDAEHKKLSTVIEQSASTVIITDIKGNIEYVNKSFTEVTGYSFDEVIGKNPRILNSGMHPKAFFKNLWITIKAGKTWKGELKNKTKKGSLYWEQATITPIINKEGIITNFLSVREDITELKITGQKLKNQNKELELLSSELSKKNNLLLESRTKYLNLFEQSPVSLWEEDFSEVIKLINNKQKSVKNLKKYLDQNPDFVQECIANIKILNVNNATLSLTGFTNKEELINYFNQTISADEIEILKQEFIAIAKGERDFSKESYLIKNNGKRIDVILNLTIIDERGRAILSILDISEIKKGQIALKIAKEKAEESEELTKSITQYAPNAIITINSSRSIMSWNNASEKIFGYTYSEMLNQKIDKIIPTPYFSRHKARLQHIMQSGKEKLTSKPIEILALRKDGTKLPIELTLTSWNFGNEECFTCIIRDITDIKIANEKLIISKEKAEASDRLKTEFLHNMSHEIRTPMNGILGFSELLEIPNLNAKKRQHYIKVVKNSGHQLLQIIDDILEISRLDTKQVKVRDEEVCLNDLFFELFTIFEMKAKENKTPLYVNKGLSDRESNIISDKVKLNKIISNLLENAFKFTNKGTIEFGYKLTESNTIKIYVKDSGIGIHPNKHKLIFDRFSQAEKEVSKKTGGLGLGLSIAKENAELLGGSIELKSGIMKGATFIITLPYTPVYSMKESIETDKKQTPENKKLTILVAEDEEMNFLYLEILLKDRLGLNCDIVHAINGVEAVACVKNNPKINMVLMDIKMPKMNGYEATQKIKKMNPNIPIIAQTAYSTKEDNEKALASGCVDFISKPINKEILKSVINKHIEEHSN